MQDRNVPTHIFSWKSFLNKFNQFSLKKILLKRVSPPMSFDKPRIVEGAPAVQHAIPTALNRGWG